MVHGKMTILGAHYSTGLLIYKGRNFNYDQTLFKSSNLKVFCSLIFGFPVQTFMNNVGNRNTVRKQYT